MRAEGDEPGSGAAPPNAALPLCSAKGCRAPAAIVLVWRNPRLHHGGRVKRWAACPDHEERLAGFLAARDFLLRREPPSAAAPDEPAG